MSTVYDSIVVGGGVLGLSTAYQLALRKQKTILLEQFSLPHTRGSSSGGSRLIRSVYAQHHYVELMPESYELWNQIQEETGIEIIRNTGLLFTQTEPRDFFNTSLASMKREKQAHELFSKGTELVKRFPGLKYDDRFISLLDSSAGVLRANKCLEALQKLILHHGGEICDDCKVLDIIPGDIVTLVTNGRRYQTRSLILTPGPWANELLATLNIKLPIKTMPGYQTFWRLKKGESYHSTDKQCPCILHWMEKEGGAYQFVYVVPTWEYPDMIKIGTRFEPNPQYLGPECRDQNGPGDIIPYLQEYVKKHLPFVHDKPSLVEPCVYAVTSDKDYIIDRHPQHKNIIIGAGLSGHGFKTAPVLGKLLTEMSLNEETSYDVRPFRMKQFENVQKSKI